ncbi:MAG: DUF4397 domain-containing protein [Vulcanimicrobiota bacterium]
MARLLLVLCLLTTPTWGRVRCVSLVEAQDLKVSIGERTVTLPTGQPVGPWQNPAEVTRITLQQAGRPLLSQRLGLPAQPMTLVFFGLPSARSKTGVWDHFRARFEGQEYHSARGYGPQLRVLRDHVRTDKNHASLRVMHAVPTLVGLDLVEADRELIAGLEYAHCSEILDLEAGHHLFQLHPAGSTFELTPFAVDLEAGQLTTVLLGGSPRSIHPVILTSKGS